MKEYIIAFECPVTESSERIAYQVQQKLVGELIRCKDCKYMVEHKGYGYLGESAYTCESKMDGWILPDNYCSMAERKEE